ncbi:MAG: T9SS type A sorting domain-containing protein [Chitinophagales bacterium]
MRLKFTLATAVLCVLSLFTQPLQAQHCAGASGSSVCTANSSITTVGFFPPYDSLPCATIGAAYDQIVQFHTPPTVTQGTSTYNLNWVRIDTVSNLPCGLCWRSGSSSNQINGNATGCIRVTGTTYDAPGQYKLHVIVSANVQVGIFPFTVSNQDAEALGLRYYVRVADLAGSCVAVDTLSAGRTTTASGTITTPTITGPASFCSGSNATLSINAASYYAYKWSTGAITSSINVTTAGTYTVTAYAACSSVTASKTVTVTPAPTAAITPATATICNGGSTTLTASGGGTYAWSSGPTTAAITVSPTTTTTYTVTVTASGCTATASRSVTVNPLPTPLITPPTATICAGFSTTLTASGGTSYAWNTTATTAAITVSPSANTTYTVTVTDANSCSATANRLVTVNQLPTATISPATVTICSGNSATLTAAGGTSYAWSTGGNTAAITVSPVSNATYTVTVTDANSCSATAARIVNVNTPAVATVNPSTATVCAGVSTTLTASAGSSYAWSNGGATQAIAVTPANTATYTVTVTDANSCTSTASSTVTVNQAPTAAITPASSAICTGSSATLTASGGSSYLWSDNSTTAVITVSPANTATYSVTVTNSNNCTASASRTVIVNQLPVVSISPATSTICAGSSTTLTAGGAVSYLWSDNTTNNTLTVSPLQQTTYNVTGTDANNCSATASAQVNVNAVPTASISPSSSAICSGNSTTLTANGGGTYAWSTGSVNPAITVSPVSNSTYTVTVTAANNCTATASAGVTVNNNPTAAINATATTICNGNSSTLTASGGTNYNWSDGSNTAAITVSPTSNSIYTVTVSDANNCSASATQSIQVTTVSTTLVANGPTTFCAGGSVTLDAGAGFDTYNWSTGATTQTITANSSGNFTCTVTQNGCTGVSNTVVVTETANNLSPVISGAPTLNICPGALAQLDAGAGYDTYSWSDGGSGQVLLTHDAGIYSVTVTSGTCSGTASIEVTKNNFPVPVHITPPGPVNACAGDTVTLDAGSYTGYYGYAWSTNEYTQTIQVTQSGTYYLTVTQDYCYGVGAVQVNINPLPVASISPATSTLCAGSSTTLTASGGSTYLWNDNTSTAALIVAPSATSTYSVTVTDVNNCTASASASVSVNSVPTASITPASITTCLNQPFSFTATGGSSYAWSDGSSTAQVSGSAANTGSYSVTVTDANQCTATAAASLTVNQLPSAGITPAQPSVCSGQSVTLTATGNGSYLWSDNSTGNTLSVSPTTNTGYSVTVTDGNNCSASASTTVSVTNLSAAITANGPTTFCSGGSVTLTATPAGASYLWSNGGTNDNISVTSSGTYNCSITLNGCNAVSNDITITVIPSTVTVSIAASPSLNICTGGVSVLDAGTGYDSYLWSTGSITHLIAADVTGTYTVTVTQGGCAATAAATVNVGTFPVSVAINPSGAQACAGDSILLDAGNSHQAYNWSNGSTAPQLFVFNSGTYTVTVTDANNCTGTASASTLFNSLPQPAITPAGAQTICAGQSITLSANATYDSYSWSTGASTASITASSAGSYALTVTQNGCSGSTSAPVSVTVHALPQASISPATANVCSGSSTTLTASGGTSYVWDDASTQAARQVIPTTLSTYTVTVTDANNCTASASASVGVNPTPNVSIISSETSNIICAGTPVDLYALGGSSFTWSTGATAGSISVTPNSTNTYAVTVTDANNCSGAASQTIVVNNLPQASVSISQVGSSSDYLLQATPSGLQGYIWQQAVANDTTNQMHFNYPTNTDTFTANCITNGGYYRVLVTDANGCSARSGYVTVPFCTAINDVPQLLHFAIMPNPANDVLTVVYELNSDTRVKLQVLDITGRIVMDVAEVNQTAGKYNQTLQLNNITSGIYLLNFTTEKGRFNTRFIKE